MAVGATVTLPDTAREPLQAPDATQLVALVEDQARFVDEPWTMTEGVADSVTVGSGGGGGDTLTDSEAEALPELLMQVSANMAFAPGDTISLPATDLVPLQPPEAVQPLALVLDQVSDTVEPATIAAGVAVSTTVGMGGGGGGG